MRFVLPGLDPGIKSEAAQAIASVHRVRDRLIGQRTMLLNALRAQMAEFGMVAATGPGHVRELVARLGEPDSLPAMLREALLGLVRLLDAPEREIAAVDKQLLAWHRESEVSRRLASIPGLRPITSSALAARVLQPERFRRGRDFAAWPGLAWLGAKTELLGRQDPAGSDQQERRRLSAPPAGERRPGRAQRQAGSHRPLDQATDRA
jgi:transposase